MIGRYMLLLHAYLKVALDIWEVSRTHRQGLYDGSSATFEQATSEARGLSLMHLEIAFVPSHPITGEMCSCLLIRRHHYLIGLLFLTLVQSNIDELTVLSN